MGSYMDGRFYMGKRPETEPFSKTSTLRYRYMYQFILAKLFMNFVFGRFWNGDWKTVRWLPRRALLYQLLEYEETGALVRYEKEQRFGFIKPDDGDEEGYEKKQTVYESVVYQWKKLPFVVGTCWVIGDVAAQPLCVATWGSLCAPRRFGGRRRKRGSRREGDLWEGFVSCGNAVFRTFWGLSITSNRVFVWWDAFWSSCWMWSDRSNDQALQGSLVWLICVSGVQCEEGQDESPKCAVRKWRLVALVERSLDTGLRWC